MKAHMGPYGSNAKSGYYTSEFLSMMKKDGVNLPAMLLYYLMISVVSDSSLMNVR